MDLTFKNTIKQGFVFKIRIIYLFDKIFNKIFMNSMSEIADKLILLKLIKFVLVFDRIENAF